MCRSEVTWFISRFVIFAVYLLCSCLNNGDERQSPPYRDHASHFQAPRLIALRGGDRNEETPKTENKREMLMRRACARAHNFLLLDRSLQPTPSQLCGLASWPLLGACSMYPGE